MKTTKAQRNDIFGAIVGAGLNPAECEISILRPSSFKGRSAVQKVIAAGMPDQVSVNHRSSGSSFRYWKDAVSRAYAAHIQVGDEPLETVSKTDWPGLRGYLHVWAMGVRKWMETPDLWEEFRNVAESLQAAESTDSSNALFAPEEQAEISARIQQVKNYIRTAYELTADQLARVEERLDEAEEASRRLGRKDWMNAFLGATFGLLLSDVISQQAATHIVITVVTGLGHLFGVGSVAPGLPPG